MIYTTKVLHVHPTRLVIHNQVESDGQLFRRGKNVPSELLRDPDYYKEISTKAKNRFNLRGVDNKSYGRVSSHAAKKIDNAIDYLVFLADEKKLSSSLFRPNLNWRLAFVTLTLCSPQIHSDNEIKSQILNQFLVEAKKRWRVNRYVWRAEKQQNGNIHFHLLVDKFIPHVELRAVWNRILEKRGYVSRYREEMQAFHAGGFRVREDLLKHWSRERQLKAYRNGVRNDWRNPNSTDIHSVKLVSNVQAYVKKYMGKNDLTPEEINAFNDIQSYLDKDEQISDEQLFFYSECRRRIIQGRLWGCSTDLSQLRGAVEDLEPVMESELSEFSKLEGVRMFVSDHATMLYYKPETLMQSNAWYLQSLLLAYCYDKFECDVFNRYFKT